MSTEQFFSALGTIDDKYILEAVTCQRKQKSGRLRWGAVAACLCLLGIGGFFLSGILYPRGTSQDPVVQDIAALDFNGCFYEVCDLDWVLEKHGLPGKITAEMAGEHLAYLQRDDGTRYEETTAQTEIELYQYAPSPCRGVYVVRDGERYAAALFCNIWQPDSNTHTEFSELYRIYGASAAQDISAIARTESRWGQEAVIGNIVTEPEAIAQFYAMTTALASYGNDDFQNAVFQGIPEEAMPDANTAFADDGISVRIELTSGLRFSLRVYPGYGWIYTPGTLSYYKMDEAAYQWFETYFK